MVFPCFVTHLFSTPPKKEHLSHLTSFPTGLLHGERPCLLVGADAQLHGLRRCVAVRQRQEALLVAGVRRVRHQLAEEDVLRRLEFGFGGFLAR